MVFMTGIDDVTYTAWSEDLEGYVIILWVKL